MNGSLTIAGAFLLGLLASGHCLVMCGGISGALALVTRSGARGRPRLDLLAGYQIGRIASYALAGLSLAGIGSALVQFVDQDTVRTALRWFSGALIAAVGTSLLMRGRAFDLTLGSRVWKHVAPLARGLMPVRTVGQALLFGAVWGWMPCGLAYSVLFIAWLTMDPLRSAAIMLAFGLGTVPAVVSGALGARAGLRLLSAPRLRAGVALTLVLFGVTTATAPWLMAHAGLHAHWLPFDCTPSSTSAAVSAPTVSH